MNATFVWFIQPPTNKELQEAAATMKGGKAYLFKDKDGDFYLYSRRYLPDISAKNKTFIGRVQKNSLFFTPQTTSA